MLFYLVKINVMMQCVGESCVLTQWLNVYWVKLGLKQSLNPNDKVTLEFGF